MASLRHANVVASCPLQHTGCQGLAPAAIIDSPRDKSLIDVTFAPPELIQTRVKLNAKKAGKRVPTMSDQGLNSVTYCRLATLWCTPMASDMRRCSETGSR